MCYVWWTCFSTDSQHSYGYQLCPLLVDWFFYSKEADFLQGFLKKNEKKLPYIDGVLSLNNSMFGDFVDRIYHIELEIKDTTDTAKSSSYLDLQLEIGSDGQLKRNFTTKETILISTL